jgi:protein JSN1
MEAEERMTGPRYRPPALRGTLGTGNTPGTEGDSVNNVSAETPVLPPTNFPPGFRRARAGTLPSNVQLAAQRFAATSNNLSSTHGSTESFTEQLQQQNTNPAPAPTIRPSLRHSASVATSSILSDRNSRLRSGSLTLPSGNMSDAFGSSLFSSSWLTGGGSGFPVLDELRSVASMDSGGDDFDVHTLDYLGLDDFHRTPAATISELRSQAQAAIAGNLSNPPRLRASTVSNPYRMRSFVNGGLLQASNTQDDEEYYEENGFTNQHLDSFDDPLATNNFLQPSYVPQNYRQSDHLNAGIGSRPRAISVGNLDESTRLAQRRASVADPQNYLGDLTNPNAGLNGLPAGILKSDKLPANTARNVSAVHFPNGEVSNSRVSPFLSAPGSNQGGRLSPKNEAPNSQLQTPTRSLWIGNLDSSVTSEQLIHVFAPYGAIESLRLLPEKVWL